jgi:hypothetical protein
LAFSSAIEGLCLAEEYPLVREPAGLARHAL